MFCNQCGTENGDDVKFCNQCGNPLSEKWQDSNNDTLHVGKATVPKSGTNKRLIKGITAVVLAGVAAFHIVIPYLSVKNIKNYDDEQITAYSLGTRNLRNIYETKSCIYYLDNGLIRVDKLTRKAKKVSGKIDGMLCATSNGIYCADYNNYEVYKITDKASKLEKATEMADEVAPAWGEMLYINGKYNYQLERDGQLTRRLNSEKYSGISVVIHEGSEDSGVLSAGMYKDYLYVIMSDNDSDTSGERWLERISLDTGRTEELTDEGVGTFEITEDNIVYYVKGEGLYVMDLDGNNKEALELECSDYYSFSCCDGKIFYEENGNVCSYDIKSGEKNKTKLENITVQSVNNQLAYSSGKTLYLLDHNGNVNTKIKP